MDAVETIGPGGSEAIAGLGGETLAPDGAVTFFRPKVKVINQAYFLDDFRQFNSTGVAGF